MSVRKEWGIQEAGNRLERRVREIDPSVRILYFPTPGYYQAWEGGPPSNPLGGRENECRNRYATRNEALRYALTFLYESGKAQKTADQ